MRNSGAHAAWCCLVLLGAIQSMAAVPDAPVTTVRRGGEELERPARAGLAKEDVTEAIRAQRGRIWACADQVATPVGDTGVKLTLRWRIRPEGQVDQVTLVHRKGPRLPTLEACVLAAAAGLQFPRAPGGGATTATHPFVISWAGSGAPHR